MVEQIKEYLKREEELAEVSKGGKYFYQCSFMDIAIRSDRFDHAKNELIKTIGENYLNEVLEKFNAGEKLKWVQTIH